VSSPDARAESSRSQAETNLRLVAQRFRAPLLSFFRKRSADTQDAEDLVQELFCRLASRQYELTLEHPEAYIFQMAANLLRDRARRSATRSAATRELSEQAKSRCEEISPERVLQGVQRVALVRQALAELPERTRAIFLLHRFEELKYAEIAQRIGVSSSLVEKHMMDALKHLKYRLERGG
jgi:RNA polymerase sigma-70 factor (ECF subfamily)